MAIKVMEIELIEQINPIRQLEKYEGGRILVRYGGLPLGGADVNNNPREETISADRVRQTIVEQSGPESAAVSDRHLPSMSVVICKRTRTVLRLEILHFAWSQWLNTLLLSRLMLPEWLVCKLVVSELLLAVQSFFAYREAYLQAQGLAALLGLEPRVFAGGVR
ncbi:hypothetical protein [Microcoleus sp.]|uniref:hypothetical protein n=1 Tax=Microcoleus sp. TaxID=44472 RepID=UPI0035940C18